MMVVRETITAVAKAAVAIAAAVEDRTRAKSAAMEYGAAGSEADSVKHGATAAMCHRAATVKASATTMEAPTSAAMEASSPAAVETTTNAAATDDFVQLKMTDRRAYDRYKARFFDVFEKFSGRLLSADENPAILKASGIATSWY